MHQIIPYLYILNVNDVNYIYFIFHTLFKFVPFIQELKELSPNFIHSERKSSFFFPLPILPCVSIPICELCTLCCTLYSIPLSCLFGRCSRSRVSIKFFHLEQTCFNDRTDIRFMYHREWKTTIPNANYQLPTGQNNHQMCRTV